MTAARLVDTNVLVYRFDPRVPVKQRIAQQTLRQGLEEGSAVVPHQALVEFVAAVSRPCRELSGAPLLERADALIEAEALARQFPVLFPDPDVFSTALRGCATYKLSWFDAHLWAYAECFGLPEILSEDFEHGQHYGRVRVINPFLPASGTVQDLPALYPTRPDRP